MPKFATRDFLPLARTQNRKVWGDLPAMPSPTMTRCVASMEEASDHAQARYLQARRDRLVRAIVETEEYPDLFWRHRYFAGLRAGVVLSTTEAVDELKRELRRELSRCKARHYTARPERVSQLREAMVFARFWRRFAKRIWLREAA